MAYVILAHTQPAQVLRLIDRLDGPGSHIFVHASTNADASFFEQVQLATAKRTNITLLERQTVHWGHFGLTEAILSAIYLAACENITFDYLTVVSGQDYPVGGRTLIEKVLNKHLGQTLMESLAVPDEIWGEFGLDRFRLRHLRIAGTEVRYPPFARRQDWIGGFARRLGWRRALPHGLRPFGGSSWFSLTSDAVHYLYEFGHSPAGRDVIRFFRTVLHPEEMLFQTILLNSELKNRVHNCDYRYIDWSKDPKHPTVLTLEDYDKIARSGAFFARKFDESTSADLLDVLDVAYEDSAHYAV